MHGDMDSINEELLRYSMDRSYYNRGQVVNAIRHLGGTATSYAIKDYLRKKVDWLNEMTIKEAQSKFENGEMNNLQKEKYIKNHIQKPLSVRQIQRILPQLKDEGVIDKKSDSHEYFVVTEKYYKEGIKHSASAFGGTVLDTIMQVHWPTLFTFEENLQKLIELFGLYVVYCFVEAARPIIIHQNQNQNSSSKQNDMIVYHWLKNVFNPNTMFLYFLSVIKNQPEDKEVEKYMSSLKSDINGQTVWTDYNGKKIKAPPNNSELSYELFTQITTPRDKYPEQPVYTLSKQQIDRITSTLEKHYPLFYQWLSKAGITYTKEMIQQNKTIPT
jgi:hypothetical protein